MGKQVVIIGAGGHAKVIADIVRKSGDFVKGFLDDNASKTGSEFFGSVILGTSADYEKYKDDCYFIIAIGNSSVRKRISEKTVCRWYTAVHPRAVISEGVTVEEGCAIMANAVINADTVIGKHTIINTGSIIEHDCKIGNFAHIAPGSTVCGTTAIGNEVWTGCGATVINNICICDGAFIGAGATVTKDITEAGTYVGTPAKRIN